MEFGKWELRDDAAYYFSKDARIFPSSNALDEGKLTTEENLRNIYRDLTDRNFVLKYNYFSLKLNATRTGVIVSPGEAIIQGYHFYTKNSVEVKVPDNRIQNSDGSFTNGPIVQYTLGISLSYDAANHVTGDVVNKDADIGESETLSGVYLKWFDECQLECNYDNILVLGRAWVQNAAIVPNATETEDGRIIIRGFEPDPFKDHKYEASSVELEIHGHATTMYDTLRDNMTQIHTSNYSYDSMHFPIELNRQYRTKPPTFVTDIQDYINHVPDWYVSKYGDNMTGALRFNNLSIDALREFIGTDEDINKFIKDSIDGKYQDSVLISPRTYGDLTRTVDDKVGSNTVNGVEKGKNYDYTVGGTIMTIVPGTYPNTTDNNYGYTGIHAALIAQQYGETGLRIHYGDGNEETIDNYTRIVQYSNYDICNKYDKQNKNNPYKKNTGKFIIENVHNGRHSSINMKYGEIFFDSYAKPSTSVFSESKVTESFKGEQNGSGIQFYASYDGCEENRNIDFRVDLYDISMAEHKYINHRTGSRGKNHNGLATDTLHFKVGLGVSYDYKQLYDSELGLNTYSVTEDNDINDPYMYLGNLRIRSNKLAGFTTKQNTIEVINTGSDKNKLPYVRIKPRVYSEQYLAEEAIQVGTTKYDDYVGNHAQDKTLNRIIIKKVNTNDNDNTNSSYTYLEQDFRLSNGTGSGLSKIFNKWITPVNNINIMDNAPLFTEIAGMYSAGNIGCSTGWLTPGSNSEDGNTSEPYADNQEWVRFTRFRYDLDKDQINGGSYTGDHIDGESNDRKGRLWGDTYNIEFNTNVANRRANQIIWRFNGSTGVQNGETLTNTPPVVLSYIHDNPNIDQGTPTRYTNWDDSRNPGYNDGKGTFETYIDHNGNTHHNPTNKIRDFLLLENAGLSISGDINNPSWCGDSLNTNNHLGVTIVQGRVYNAVYNDFAETFEKSNKEEIAKPGTLISLDPITGKYKICEEFSNNLIVGVQSNTYAFLAGGNRINGTQDIIELENEYFTVAVSGKVWVNVIENSYIMPGDMLCSSLEKGRATKSKCHTPGTIIGKALSEPKYFENDNEYKVLVLVMTM